MTLSGSFEVFRKLIVGVPEGYAFVAVKDKVFMISLNSCETEEEFEKEEVYQAGRRVGQTRGQVKRMFGLEGEIVKVAP